jgi:hypothetical protein
VKGKFNVSIAEVGANDLWQRAVVGVATVGNDHAFVNEALDKVADFVASMHGGQIQITGREIEIVPYGDAMGEGEMRTLAEAEAAAERGYEASWDPQEEWRAEGEPDEAPPPRAGGSGGRELRREAGRSESPPARKDDR